MSLNSDVIVDRRRIRRKLTFWRVLAVIIAIGAIAAIGMLVSPGTRGTFTSAGSIARINIEGLIRSDHDRVEALERLEKWKSRRRHRPHQLPGRHHRRLRATPQLADAARGEKPMVVVVDGLATSGGYITAIAADHILTQNTSLVGSIGVLFQFPNLTHLLNTVGVKVEEIKSSPLKAGPNGLEPTTRRRAMPSTRWSTTPMPGSRDW